MSFIGKTIGKVIGGITGANQAADAAKDASQTQAQAAQLGIDEQKRQFDALQAVLAPYVNAGTGSLSAQQNLLGLNGASAQQDAISGIKASPQYQALAQAGQDSILQNASATGGLRGGNTQAALGQFQPQLLSQLIQQQYSNLGGLTSLGQNSAAGVGNAGLQTGSNVAQLLQQQGAATAGGQIAQGNSARNGFGSALQLGALGYGLYSLGGLGAAAGAGATPSMIAAGQF